MVVMLSCPANLALLHISLNSKHPKSNQILDFGTCDKTASCDVLACADYFGLAHLSARSPWNLKVRPDLPIWRVLPTRNMEIIDMIVLVIFVISVSAMYVSPRNADKIVDIASRCASYWIRLRGDWMRLGGYRIRLRG